MGDMGCHFMDLPFWAHYRYPKTIEASAPKPDEDRRARLACEYVFPGVKGTTKELAVSWSDGAASGIAQKYGVEEGNGVLFIGEEGAIFSNYRSSPILNDKNKTFEAPRKLFLPPSDTTANGSTQSKKARPIPPAISGTLGV